MPLDDTTKHYEQALAPKVHDATYRVLIAAASLVRQRGLAKEIRQDGTGALCIHGAIAMAIVGDPSGVLIESDDLRFCRATAEVAKYIRSHWRDAEVWPSGSRGFVGCAVWNNAKSRTAAEVIEALSGAALARAEALAKSEAGGTP